jgi:glycyl-tRNA synthetase beta chain
MDRELLLEIGVEELPAAWLPGLTKQLSEKLQARLKEMRLTPDVAVESFSTPRRLTARIGRMPERQEDLDETITGPPVSASVNAAGEPTPAGLGFAKKQGVAFAALERVKTDKGEYIAARKHHRGKSTVDALPELLAGLLRDLTFPKQMHWDAMLDDGKGEFVFGRPIRWLLYLYGGRVVPFAISRTPGAAGSQVQEITTGAVTYGHRFLATSGRAGRSIRVRTFDEYRARLPEHFVILDHAERRDRIARELEAKARKLGGRVHLRDQAVLLDEVADLVEFPGVVAGFFDRAFLELPHEVLTTTLVHHQHYFPVLTDGGELKEAFLAVVNTQPQDERVIAKNAERVVTARLRDAKFFWDADRTIKLEDRRERLHTIVFHKKLGSYRDKAERVEQLARTIATEFSGVGGEAAPPANAAALGHADHAATAARLAKADLVSDMVFEFPELQGQMGGIYARQEGQPEAVWKAIYYQYLPHGVEADAPPSRAQLGAAAVPWAALSLADKMDTLVGMLQYEKVTGSRDPFGLRRAGHGIARILVDLEDFTGTTTRPALRPVVDAARAGYGFGPLDDSARLLVWGFLAERLRHLMTQRGLEYEEIQAVTGNLDAVADVSWRDLFDRAKALRDARRTPTFASVAEAYKRAANIVDEAWGSESHGKWGLGRDLLVEPAEVALRNALHRVGAEIRSTLTTRNPQSALTAIASLQPDLERFFTEIRVNVDDEALREARLSLLGEVRDRIYELGDISLMSVKK